MKSTKRIRRAGKGEEAGAVELVSGSATGDGTRLALELTPHGRLVLGEAEEAQELEGKLARRLEGAFARGAGHGLLRLGAGEVQSVLPAEFVYWRELGVRLVTALCARTETSERGGALELPESPAAEELAKLVAAAPPMRGAEYLTVEVLRALWDELGAAFVAEFQEARASLADFLKALDPTWSVVGRVHFHLAENRRDEQAPFAFLATYTGSVSAQGKARHQPLGQALREYAGAESERLLSLLLPVQRASEGCAWLAEMVTNGEVFHPLRWTPAEALRLLDDVPKLEHAGVIVRVPALWRAGRPPRPRVTGTVGASEGAGLGQEALLDFQVELTLEGERLTAAEAQELLASTSGLALLRGQWVEVDAERLAGTLQRFRAAENVAKRAGLGFTEALRLLAGADIAADDDSERADPQWSRIVAGPWLAETLASLRSPASLAAIEPGAELAGTLRPYQSVGVRWLQRLSSLGLGACLADDMGLGKTIQVLALLLVRRRQDRKKQPSVLVAPASLLGNWAAECARFAPSLRVLVAHPSERSASELAALTPADLAETDLVITSYGCLTRFAWLRATPWKLAILDEAQAIKNPGAQQTRAVKELVARARIALTGTPIENRLGDLWSLFDFINPGLLGSAREFTSYTKRLAGRPGQPYGPLRELVRPYLLRRLKTDRSVIADLPDKTELKAFCALTKKQAALYQAAVKELRGKLEGAQGIARRGLVLAFLMRFKQLCNHPSQWLGDGAWDEADSGKWARLREIGEVVAARQEKALVFTQFRELAAPLAAFLGAVFGRPGLVLHGGTPVAQRRALVQRFQEDERVPFFVLSLKAGGSGLNLTAAAHVIHFDRWWNPAVENQATDRAFRIGQTKNVLVHKFLCKGTVEEKIDALIESKKALATELLEGGAELDLTGMGDKELLELVALDLSSALKE